MLSENGAGGNGGTAGAGGAGAPKPGERDEKARRQALEFATSTIRKKHGPGAIMRRPRVAHDTVTQGTARPGGALPVGGLTPIAAWVRLLAETRHQPLHAIVSAADAGDLR